MSKKISIFMVFLMFLVFGGCNGISANATDDFTFKDENEEKTTQLATSTNLEECNSKITTVTNSESIQLYWSDDGNELHYLTKDYEHWLFNLAEGYHEQLDSDFDDPTHQPVSFDQTEEKFLINYNIRFLSLSPNKNFLLLLLEQKSTPVDTPTVGENYIGQPLQVYLLDQEDNFVRIGELLGDVTSFHWFPDETRVFINVGRTSPDNIHAWVVNISNQSLAAFDVSDANIFGISPSGQWIIYNKKNQVYARNVYTLEDKLLNVSLISLFFWWDYPYDSIIFLEFSNTGGFSVKHFNLTTNELNSLSEKKINVYPFQQNTASLSPNGKYLAFIEKESKGINVLTLCKE